MTIHKALPPRDDWQFIHQEKKEKELTNIVNCKDATIKGQQDYIKKSKERLITMVSNSTVKISTEKQQEIKNQMGKETTVWIF